VASLHEHCHNF